jgi:hypothetical protein
MKFRAPTRKLQKSAKVDAGSLISMANSFPVAQAWIRFASWPAYRRVQTAQSVRAQRDWEQHVFISVFIYDRR